ncbi:GntP family permease [Flavobacterium sp. MXW15]|uniref:GntP family permease n=1 Tax=Xanthomonas chitinilytica TaxID=2989819 RepID=A0ABT3JTE9_9XANT|nr:GntP family permease [Xanthomonas sp. H13-6]MCW4454528.1 GntP family permease [Flavobacterium sp. MXW15]MCW4471767.1 GntP family permease [Xanthomonas sp. H13-6]
MSNGNLLLLYATLSILALIVLIARYRLNPFISVTLVSVGLALLAGMPAPDILPAYEQGVGKTLGHIALIVALGTMLGKMMAESGGAERIARTLIGCFGPRNVHWAMMLIAFCVGLPIFFEVGFVLLIPIVLNVARRTGVPLLLVGLPMVAGLSVVHGLVPPHPAAMLAVHAYQADVGRTVFYALLVGLPTAALAGPIFARVVAPRVRLPQHNPMEAALLDEGHAGLRDDQLPGFGITLATLLLPVGLMLLGGWADQIATPGSALNHGLRFIGHSVVALLLATLASFVTLGLMRGFDRERILKFSQECLAPTAAITLLVGAGGGLNGILVQTGVAAEITALSQRFQLSPLLMGWTVAALMRVATGSATVAMTTASGIVAPIALAAHYPHPELLVLATGAGSLILSHVNDGGFWLVKEYFNMSVAQTFKTWTVLETLISLAALALVMALAAML